MLRIRLYNLMLEIYIKKEIMLYRFYFHFMQLYVGMMTNLIIFPVNFLVVQLFRKSPPRRKRKSRVKEALEAQQLGSDLITEEGGETHRGRRAYKT